MRGTRTLLPEYALTIKPSYLVVITTHNLLMAEPLRAASDESSTEKVVSSRNHSKIDQVRVNNLYTSHDIYVCVVCCHILIQIQ